MIALAAAFAVAACTDQPPTAPSTSNPHFLAQALDCAVKGGTLSCTPNGSAMGSTIDAAVSAARANAPSAPAGVSADLIIGGQHIYVTLESTNVVRTETMISADVTIKNLTNQPFGTANNQTPDANGIKVFFNTGPTPVGAGTVSVANADGIGMFLGSNEKYYQWPSGAGSVGILPSNATSNKRTWQFATSSSTVDFTFSVFVTTAVPNEADGALTAPPHQLSLLSLGSGHSCAIRTTNVAYCWGRNSYGALGKGDSSSSSIPLGLLGVLQFESVSGGSDFSCGLDGGGVPYCWGDNASGQLGFSLGSDKRIPTVVSGGQTFASIGAGSDFACGLKSNGQAWCWGSNMFGQLGNGTTTDAASPVQVTGSNYAALSVGAYHACGMTSAGVVQCWGANTDGELGNGTNTSSSTPVTATGTTGYSAIAAGTDFTCGIKGGAAFCWGSNTFGNLGDNTQTSHTAPTAVAGGVVNFTKIAAGEAHACAIRATGAAMCWGANADGQVGNGGMVTPQKQPVVVNQGVLAFAEIEAGFSHTCAATSSGAPYCWGSNEGGQLGDGTNNGHTAPTAVSLP